MSRENGQGQQKVQTSGLLLHSWKMLRSSSLLWHTVELPDDYRNFMNNEYDAAPLTSGLLAIPESQYLLKFS